MKNKILFFSSFMFMAFAHANELLNVTTQCNNGVSTSSSGYNQLGIPPTSCTLTATRIAPGFNLGSANNASVFLFDSFYSVKLNGINDPVLIRFVVYEDDKDYNAIQAIVQTAYATRAPLYINFENPTLNVFDYDSFVNLKKNWKSGTNLL